MPRNGLRYYLELQSTRVEGLLNQHHAPGRVIGGTAGPALIRLFVQPAPMVRFSQIKRLQDDLALILQVPDLTIDRGREGIVLTFGNPDPRPVTLTPLLEECDVIPVSTTILGLTDDGAPLLVRLAAPEVSHILVSGTTGSGKSVLLQTLAASLVLKHDPDVVQLVCIDPKARAFAAFENVAHLARPVITDVAEAIAALHALLLEMERRDARGERPGRGTPRIVVVIDELADLVMTGGDALVDVLVRIAQRGREAGIHLVGATQHPAAAVLGNLMRANFPLRLVGKVVSADDARVASGRAGTNAHLLNGRGDFLAISGGDQPIRFQVAREHDLDRLLAPVRRTGQPWAHWMRAPRPAEDQPALLRETPRSVRPRDIVIEEEASDGVQTAVEHLRPGWMALRERFFDGNVTKSQLCRAIWENATGYRGCWQRWLDGAVEQLEGELSTSTSTSTGENVPVYAENATDGHAQPGGGGGGDKTGWDIRRWADVSPVRTG